MLINIHVNTSSSKEDVQLVEGVYHVKFKAAREKGRANLKLVKILAEYFKVPKSKIKVIKGEKASRKVVEVVNPKRNSALDRSLHK